MTKFNGRDGVRLDKFLAENLPDCSRSRIQKMVKCGDVLVNDEKAKSSKVLNALDVVTVDIKEEVIEDIEPEEIDIEILHETSDYMVVNKPCGMVVHPSDTGYRSGTLVNAILGMIKVEDFEDTLRPGIVHRLDKDTSGLMVVVKNSKAYDYFIEQFKNRKVFKRYVALVRGGLEHSEGVINSPIARDPVNRKKMSVVSDGKDAVTKYKILENFELGREFSLSYLDVRIETGRTHQIRVHMSAIEHPVVGDDVYGMSAFNKKVELKFGLKRQFLHAAELGFEDMEGNMINIKSPLPGDLNVVLDSLRSY